MSTMMDLNYIEEIAFENKSKQIPLNKNIAAQENARIETESTQITQAIQIYNLKVG